MQPENLRHINASTEPLRASASESRFEMLAASLISSLCSTFADHERRIARMEEAAESAIAEIVTFANSRASWTVGQLAEDLQVHSNTVLNWLALPEDHPRHLDSFQPGGTGPHKILPEHVADWMSRNGQKAA